MDEFDFYSAKRVFSRIGIALIVFNVVTFVAQLFGSAVLASAFPNLFKDGFPSSLEPPFLAFTMYLIGLPVFCLCLKDMPTDVPAKNKCRVGVIWSSFLIACAFSYFGNMLGTSLASLMYEATGKVIDSGNIEYVGNLKWYESFILTAVIGSLAEEFMFRKIIIDRTRAYGEKLSVIFSALLFGFSHMSIIQFCYAFPAGLLLGYLYVRKGSLVYCWIVHGLFNFFGAVIPRIIIEFTDYENMLKALENPEAMYKIIEERPLDVWIISAFGLLTIAFAFLGAAKLGKRIKTMHFEKTVLELPKDTEATTAFLNAGVIIFILCAILYPFLIAL